MKDEIKGQLDALFADEAAQKMKAEQKRGAEAERQAAFLEQFGRVTDDVIAPAFEEFAVYLNPQGWGGLVKRESEAPAGQNYRPAFSHAPSAPESVSLVFSHATRAITGINKGDQPRFMIRCDKVKRLVHFHETTPSMSGPAGSAKLDEVTADYLQEKLVTYFKKLMHDARPHDEQWRGA